MSETRIFLGLGQTAALLWNHDHDRRSVSKCGTCGGLRQFLAVDRRAGFCEDCLERSRSVDADDIGGES
jgi:hypothetical protein